MTIALFASQPSTVAWLDIAFLASFYGWQSTRSRGVHFLELHKGNLGAEPVTAATPSVRV